MRNPDLILLAMGIAVFAIGIGVYIRKRLAIHRILRDSMPITVDGWMTYPNEPEFPEIIKSEQNEAFGRFCGMALYGLYLFAAAYGFNVKPDIFAYLLDHA